MTEPDSSESITVTFKKQNIIEILSKNPSLQEFNNLTELLSVKFQPTQEDLIQENISIKLDESRLFSVVSNNEDQNNIIESTKDFQITTATLKKILGFFFFFLTNNFFFTFFFFSEEPENDDNIPLNFDSYATLVKLNKNSCVQEINNFVDQIENKSLSLNKKSINSKTILNLQFPSGVYIL